MSGGVLLEVFVDCTKILLQNKKHKKKDVQKDLKKLEDMLYKQLLPYNIEISN